MSAIVGTVMGQRCWGTKMCLKTERMEIRDDIQTAGITLTVLKFK